MRTRLVVVSAFNYIEGNFETLFSRSDHENSFFTLLSFTPAVIRCPLSHLVFMLPQILHGNIMIFCKSISLFGHQADTDMETAEYVGF